MAKTFHIPRQTDRELIRALGLIRQVMKPVCAKVFVQLPYGPQASLDTDNPENAPELQFALDAGGETIETCGLTDRRGRQILNINRAFDQTTDSTYLHDPWTEDVPEGVQRSEAWIKFIASARKELRASDLQVAFKGQEDTAWNQYRETQAQVVNSLQQTSETLLVNIAKRNLQLEKDREEKYSALEKQLRDELAIDRAKLEKGIAAQREDLQQQQKALADEKAAFVTKEARYVARKKQQEQMDDIKKWLEGWSVTKGSAKKRLFVTCVYSVAIAVTAFITIWTLIGNYKILITADAVTKLAWWQWAALTLKTALPFAAFITFIVYLIRWSAAWAAQHAEEDFRNRSRVLDIGRASWLLEAVHDAQEHNKEIPSDLLKELSRNMFVHTSAPQDNLHPQVAADLLLQGLSSLRVKTPAGTEVEAKRGK